MRDKLRCLQGIASRHQVALDRIAFIGDDLSDLAVLKAVGLPFAVGDAVEEVKKAAEFVTSRYGGQGAVREACEYVLKLNGHGDDLYTLSGYQPADDDE
jgi:3-deoxy-D-manno-octulosonate 8-phosphate phosphatase (KDO 8-P phosphatase)